MVKRTTKTKTKTKPQKASGKKHVYFFGNGKADGNRHMKDLLGGKGSGLAEMTNAPTKTSDISSTIVGAGALSIKNDR